ncbi:acyltransferase family protein [Streptomyces sp. URMC 125]|uniref:acyltransferase family protein n=1 Tax=Streptomyces sp. URMC 125 TaxID=3423419 RepID=UPI003F1AD77B
MFHAGYERSPLPPARPDEAARPVPPAPEAAPAAARGGGGQAKQRDPYFDNAKFLAIVLVVIGHAWAPMTGDSRIMQALYGFVYVFHMPAFVLISGYFSRSFDMRPKQLKRLVTTVVVPYVVFEAAYTVFKRTGDAPEHALSLLDPWFLTWFLVALFVWRLTTPLWKAVRWPVPLSVAIAVMASLSPQTGGDLSMQRVLQFLPFFVLGLRLRPEHFLLVRRRAVRLVAAPVAVASLAVTYWATTRMDFGWLYHQKSVQGFGVPWWIGAPMNLALLCCSLVLTVCFLAWVPGRRTWFTALGVGTLYAYLLHGFFAQWARMHDWYDRLEWIYTPAGAIAVTAAAAVLGTVLCTTPVQRVFRPVVEPRVDWIFKPDASPAGSGRGGPSPADGRGGPDSGAKAGAAASG